MADKYYSFEEAAQKLGITEDDLINLVSNNALRSYRKGGDTMFKAEDIDNYQPSSQSAPGMESQVIELDDLPDDIEMVDATADDAPVSDDSFTETVGVSGETNLDAQADEPQQDSLVIDAEEPALATPEENGTMDADSQNANGELEIEVEEPQDTPPAAAPELDDSGIDGETVMTDSSALGITEEITADDDVSVNTQEITLQETAISDDEATMPIDTDQGDFTEDLSEAAGPSVSKRARVSGRASGYSARAHAAPPPAAGSKGGLLWTVIIAATVLVMLYPAFLLISIVCFDFADTRTTIGVGDQKIPDTLGKRAPLRNVGRPVVPEYYRWIVEKPISDGKKMHEWFGTRKTAPGGKDGFDKFYAIAVEYGKDAEGNDDKTDLKSITRNGKEIEVKQVEEAEPETEEAEPAEGAEKADKAEGEEKSEEKNEEKAEEKAGE